MKNDENPKYVKEIIIPLKKRRKFKPNWEEYNKTGTL